MFSHAFVWPSRTPNWPVAMSWYSMWRTTGANVGVWACADTARASKRTASIGLMPISIRADGRKRLLVEHLDPAPQPLCYLRDALVAEPDPAYEGGAVAEV